MKTPIKHHLDNKTDKRYTITKEFCGYAKPKYVARFCGEWINSADNLQDAIDDAQEHYDNHKIDAVYN